MSASQAAIARCRDAGAGFTLFEVVVALAIAALALVELFQVGSGGLAAVDTASRVEEAVQRAESHLATLGRGGPIVPGRTGGNDGDGYRWQAEAQPIAQQSLASADTPAAPAAASAQVLYDVAVTVSWQSGRRTRSVVLRTRRLAAAPAGE